MDDTYQSINAGGSLVGSIFLALFIFWIIRKFISNQLVVAFISIIAVVLLNLLLSSAINAIGVIGSIIGSILGYFYFKDRK